MEGGEPGNRFLSYWDYDTRRTCPLILAKIPGEESLGSLCLTCPSAAGTNAPIQRN